MKQIKLLLLLLMLTATQAYSQLQQIKIVSLTVKNQLPAVIDTWANIPGSLLLVAQLPPNVQVKGIRLMVQIKSNGALVCGNNATGGLQVDEFTTRTFSAAELTGTLQGCRDLKEGSYSICVQFYNVDRVAISNEVCKEFNVEAQNIEYTPPTLINPENGKVFTETELSRPVTFRWTPNQPKPQGPVTYRLKVWQLMQGQNGTQAMRTNQPIITKDVDNITQTVVNSIINGPCKPPYMCDFIWAVQSLNREGKPIGKNEGTSEPYTFKVETNTTTYSAPQLVSPNDGKAFAQNEMSAPVFFRWTPLVPKPQSAIYRLKVWQLMQGQNGTQAMRTNQPIVTKDVDNITQAAITGIYTGPCKPPYMCDFIWQVQAIDRQDNPIGNNEGKSEVWAFKVTENGVSECLPPKLVAPADAKSFLPKDMSAPVLFRWTPNQPKPQGPVSYRLKVWQLMQGQNGTQAMRSNKPIVEKDVVDITEASVANLYTGPCKPPYMCDFIWEVQALTADGKPACATNEGKSEPATFTVKNNGGVATNPVENDTPCTTPVITLPANGTAFNKDTKIIEIKGKLGKGIKQTGIELYKISSDPNLVNDLKQRSKGSSFFSAVETFDYTGEGKKVNAIAKKYDVQVEKSTEGSNNFSAFIPTSGLEQGSYYIVVNNGNCPSAPMAFSMSAGCGTNTDSVTIECNGWVNGMPTYLVKVKFTNIPSTTGGLNCSTLMNTISVAAGMGSPGTFTTLPATIPSGGSVTVTFPFTPATASQTSVSFNYFGIWNDGYSNTSNFGSGVITLPSCVCNECEKVKWSAAAFNSTLTSTNFNINQAFNPTGPGNIVAAKAEIIAFERYVGDSCVGCNKDYTQWGNFTSGTYGGATGSPGSAVAPVTGNTSHSLYWNAPGGGYFPTSSSFSLNINKPAFTNTGCCCERVAVTIRYTFSFKSQQGRCVICSFVRRYEQRRGNCPGGGNDNPTGIDNPIKN